MTLKTNANSDNIFRLILRIKNVGTPKPVSDTNLKLRFLRYSSLKGQIYEILDFLTV